MEKDDNHYVLTLDGGETIDLSGIIDTDDTVTFDVSSISGSMADSVYTLSGVDTTLTVGNSITLENNNWIYTDTKIDPDEVDRMCKEYPGLEKVWRNFKSVYDMVQQDFEGKKKAGELDDDIPF